MFYLPPGSMMQLIDGRVLHKDHKTNMWKDNMGVPITEQQLQFMMSFPSFSEDPSGGGDSPVATTPASDPDPVVSLSAPFDDIVARFSVATNENANRTITTTAPVTLRLTFAAGTYVASSAVVVYKNDVAINPGGIRISSSPPSPVTLPGTFANGDQLKFVMSNNSTTTRNFDVTIEKIEPGSVQVVDTFNMSCPAITLQNPFEDIVASNSSEVQNTQNYVYAPVLGASTIRLNFSSGVYNGVNGSLLVYKDDVLIDTISVSSRPNGTGLYVLSQTFDAHYLKFGFLGGDGGNDFNVTVEKTAPDGLVTMDTFNVRSTYSS